MSYPDAPHGWTPPTVLPPKKLRRPKRIKVEVGCKRGGGYSRELTYRRVLTYHVYGKRPKRGDHVRIRDGLYTGKLGQVKWRHSPFYRGFTYLAEIAHPKGWSE